MLLQTYATANLGTGISYAVPTLGANVSATALKFGTDRAMLAHRNAYSVLYNQQETIYLALFQASYAISLRAT
eukprot:1246254-Rhodomonas_salina.2